MSDYEQRKSLAGFGAIFWFVFLFSFICHSLALVLHAFAISLPTEALSIEDHGIGLHLLYAVVDGIIVFLTCRSPRFAWSVIKEDLFGIDNDDSK